MGEPDLRICKGIDQDYVGHTKQGFGEPIWKSSKCNETQYLSDEGFCTNHCPSCKEFMKPFYAAALKDRSTKKEWSAYIKHVEAWHGVPVIKPTSHEGNGKYLGPFAFTLTKSPSDDFTVEQMVLAVRKIMGQKSNPVKYFAWYLEYKENLTHPHIHGMYETESKGRIEAKHWKRQWPIWDEKQALGKGFRGGYHRPVRNEEGYSTYIIKDLPLGHPHDSRVP